MNVQDQARNKLWLRSASPTYDADISTAASSKLLGDHNMLYAPVFSLAISNRDR